MTTAAAGSARAPALRFNARPGIESVEIGGGLSCLVVDEALAEPDAWVEYAAARRGDFQDDPENAYPGPELALPAPALESLDGFFAAHARRAFGGRRTLRSSGRLSLATRRADELLPRQWICHVDRLDMAAGERIAASVLYLFRDPALGGTAFFRPRHPVARIVELVQASARLTGAEFERRYGVAPGYMTESNAWFERVAAVPARFNRLVLYPGSVFHGAHITAPERLSPDPAAGRLTLNGFFVCRRNLD